MKRLKTFLFAGSAIVLGGCAGGMSENACVSADWYSIGVADGSAGNTEISGISRAESCAEFGISMDALAYEDGRQVGLARYCTPNNGYSAGLSGSNYNGVCINHDEAAYLAEYEAGRAYKGFQDAVRVAESDLRSAQDRIDRIDEKLDEMQRDVERAEAGERDPIDMDKYFARRRELIREQDDLLEDLTDLKVDLRFAERVLEEYEIELEVQRRIDTALAAAGQ